MIWVSREGTCLQRVFLIAKMQRVNVLSNTAMHSCPHQDNFMNENAAKVGMEHSVEFYLPRRIFKL